jgi:hypothetical protein
VNLSGKLVSGRGQLHGSTDFPRPPNKSTIIDDLSLGSSSFWPIMPDENARTWRVTTAMQFHEHLRNICNSARITGRELARESGLHEDSITRYLVGLRPSEKSKRFVQEALRRLLSRRSREVENARVTLQKIV